MSKRFDNSDFDPEFDGSEIHEHGFDHSELVSFKPGTGIAPGTLLVASPALKNTPFEKAVVFVLQNSQDGIFGVVLNRPANDQLRTAWHQMTGDTDGEQSLVHGGPIGGPVFALHQDQDLAEMAMPGGVFVSTASDKVQEIVRERKSDYRIVFGVAGWNHPQLVAELNDGCWFQLKGDAQQVFEDPDWMWEKSLRRYSNQLICDVVGVQFLPSNPSFN